MGDPTDPTTAEEVARSAILDARLEGERAERDASVAAVRWHPAKFSDPILEQLRDLLGSWLPDGGAILDPFAGVGKVHQLAGPWITLGVELEPVFAAAHDRTQVGDATCLEFNDDTFDGIVTSPVYPNRMTDHHNATDPCRTCNGERSNDGQVCKACGGLGLTMRNTYTHRLRVLTGDRTATLHPNNAGAMTGRRYWRLHEQAVAEMVRVTRPGGFLFVNVSNHLKTAGGVQHEVDVVGRWVNLLSIRGCLLREVRPVATRRLRHGANSEARADHEVVVVAQTPAVPSAGTLL